MSADRHECGEPHCEGYRPSLAHQQAAASDPSGVPVGALSHEHAGVPWVWQCPTCGLGHAVGSKACGMRMPDPSGVPADHIFIQREDDLTDPWCMCCQDERETVSRWRDRAYATEDALARAQGQDGP